MKKLQPVFTFTSDFGMQSEGIASMESAVLKLVPDARIIHLAHGLPSYNLSSAARVLETVRDMPIGYHICVVDPSTDNDQKDIVIETGRGDYLIGPDNGVLLPAASRLGGIRRVISITNAKYMHKDVSSIFHGRDVCSPIAAHLSLGVKINDLGEILKEEELQKAPYQNAEVTDEIWKANVVRINRFGSCYLNITEEQWADYDVKIGQVFGVRFGQEKTVRATYQNTFGEVEKGAPLILKDASGRMMLALNLEDFSDEHEIELGDECMIWKG